MGQMKRLLIDEPSQVLELPADAYDAFLRELNQPLSEKAVALLYVNPDWAASSQE